MVSCRFWGEHFGKIHATTHRHGRQSRLSAIWCCCHSAPTDHRFIAPVPRFATKKAWAALCSSFSAS
jgi:hypothetical protein